LFTEAIECSICNRVFKNKLNFRTHILRTHHIRGKDIVQTYGKVKAWFEWWWYIDLTCLVVVTCFSWIFSDGDLQLRNLLKTKTVSFNCSKVKADLSGVCCDSVFRRSFVVVVTSLWWSELITYKTLFEKPSWNNKVKYRFKTQKSFDCSKFVRLFKSDFCWSQLLMLLKKLLFN
jgi:hypothetical protein